MQGMRFNKLLQGKKALITDLDGTLTNLGIDWDSLREKVRREMGWSHPLRPLGMNIPKAARNEEEIEKAFSIVEKAELEAAERASFNPSLRLVLSKIRRSGLKIGLVTLQARRPATKALDRLGVIDLFDVIVTREYSLDRKKQLGFAMEKLGVRPSECIFVGDAPWDVKAGKELGCLTICVRREVEGADMYVESLEDLATID